MLRSFCGFDLQAGGFGADLDPVQGSGWEVEGSGDRLSVGQCWRFAAGSTVGAGSEFGGGSGAGGGWGGVALGGLADGLADEPSWCGGEYPPRLSATLDGVGGVDAEGEDRWPG